MPDRFDVVIVGARAAGSPLATHLARAGLSVCVLDRATFPSDTVSTHVVHNIPAYRRLGVLDPLLATGAPLLTASVVRIDGLDLSCAHPDLPALCVRRPALDQTLLDAAGAAGADVRTGHRVVSLCEERGRVAGVHATDADGRRRRIAASLVVGADGRSSTVARLVGSARYNVTRGERASYWAYYEGVAAAPALHFYRRGRDLFMAAPTDAGLFLAISMPSPEDVPAYRDRTGAGFDRALAGFPPLGELLAGARRTGPPLVMPGFQGFFRESAGPGWVLVGDAGHFKDTTSGQGISDALRQAERLAGAIAGGWDGPAALNGALAAWWRWRDRDAAAMYWLSQDLGRAGTTSATAAEILRGLAPTEDGRRELREVIARTRAPSDLFTPGRVLAATGRRLLRDSGRRGGVLAETAAAVVLEAGRRRRNRRPRFA